MVAMGSKLSLDHFQLPDCGRTSAQRTKRKFDLTRQELTCLRTPEERSGQVLAMQGLDQDLARLSYREPDA